MKKNILRLLSGALVVLLFYPAVLASNYLTVNWYHKEQYLRPVIDAFTAETGINVDVTSDYDTFNTDVIFVSDYKGLLEAKHYNHFQKLDQAFFNDMSEIVPEEWRDEGGFWLGVMLRVRTAVVNKNNVQAADYPRDILDLADPKWRGKMTIRSAANVYNRSLLAYMISRYGHKKAKNWAQGIIDNFGPENPRYQGDTGNLKLVAMGDYDISFANTYYLGYLKTRTGSETDETRTALEEDLGVVWLDKGKYGLPVNVTGVGISRHVKDSEKLDQAQQLIRFILSPKGQMLMSENVFKYPVRADVPASEYLARFGTFKMDKFNLNTLEYLYDDADKIMKDVGWQSGW